MAAEATGAESDPSPPWRRWIRWTSTGLTVLIALGWFIFLRPQFLGGPASYIRISGTSMEPLYHSNDLVVVTEQDAYEVGDVLAFRIPEGEEGEGVVVIHRVIGGDAASGYVMQGDNRETEDQWRPTPEEVVGKAIFKIPGARIILPILFSPLGLALIAGLGSMWILLSDDEKKPSEEP